MSDQLWVDHEKKIRKVINVVLSLLAISILMTFVPLTGVLQPSGESMGTWWQRAGAPIAVFSFLAQNKANFLGALLTPGSFTGPDMNRLRLKYKPIHNISVYVASTMTVVGTLIWGYGDLAFKVVTASLPAH